MDEDIRSLEVLIDGYVGKSNGGPASMTLTWAQSLDRFISAGRGLRTKLSGAHSHKMTHYLRTLHDAILVGRGTVEADNPKLNCRYPGFSSHPQPIILDSQLNWKAEDKDWAVLKGKKAGTGKAPWVLTTQRSNNRARVEAIEAAGGAIFVLKDLEWATILDFLGQKGIANVMVEGGAQVISGALQSRLSSCIIVTVAPVFLGNNGVCPSPSSRFELKDIEWWCQNGIADCVLFSRPT